MADTITKVTRTSWLERVKNSIGGIFFGILLIIVACIILFKNEGRAVKTAKGLKEGSENVISLASPETYPANEDKLIHLYGQVQVNGTLADAEFNFVLPAVHYKRSVEMFQWVEKKETRKEIKTGGAEETTTTYTYTKDWCTNLVSSSSFQEPQGHENPLSMPYSSASMSSSDISVGSFSLSSSLISKINRYTCITPNENNITNLPQAVINGNYVFIGTGGAASPAIGDIRISFSQVLPEQVSIVAQQKGSSLVPHLTAYNTKIEMLDYGVVPADQMFEKAQRNNKALTWILRFVGFLMIFIGFKLIFAPIGVLVSVLPFLARLANLGTGIVSFLLSISISIIVIAIGWIVYRPVLGILLLVVGIGSLLGIKFLKQKQND